MFRQPCPAGASTLYSLRDGDHIRPQAPAVTLSCIIGRVVFVCAVLLATTSAQDFPQSEEPASVIRNEYLHAYNLHDANSVLALYADDAVLLTEAGVFEESPKSASGCSSHSIRAAFLRRLPRFVRNHLPLSPMALARPNVWLVRKYILGAT
jgi:hypothetical protein